MFRIVAISALALFLSACVSGNFVGRGEGATSPQASNGGMRKPQVMRGRGIDSVIGQPAAALSTRFGNPRIDLVEGDARKLQFASDLCVLDIFLYPVEEGQAPVATHIASRQKQGGGQIDNAACINAIAAARR